METQSLRAPDVFPFEDGLASALSNASNAYQQLIERLFKSELALVWRYDRDGKAWLGKGVSGKKTIFWLSVWAGFFRISLYFIEKMRAPIQQLPIADEFMMTYSSIIPSPKLVRETPAFVASLFISVWKLAPLLAFPGLRGARSSSRDKSEIAGGGSTRSGQALLTRPGLSFG
ncbi:MAG: DUF3788 domain-containing protein [Myxococcales bacterium]|jgi:hypothetical protein|nr:DUF3788 domain-containing protein [Myxococcales bacterium]